MGSVTSGGWGLGGGGAGWVSQPTKGRDMGGIRGWDRGKIVISLEKRW